MFAAFVVYFTIVLICVFLSRGAYTLKDKSIRFFVAYLIPVLYSAILLGGRINTGSDWENYKEYYDEILKHGLSLSELFSSMLEPAYLLLNMAVASLGVGSSFFFAVVTVIHLSVIYILYRKNPRMLPYGLFFYLMGNMSLDVNVVRQSIALSCMVVSSLYIIDKRFVAFLLFLLAVCFHYSAFFVAPILLIDKPLFRFLDNTYVIVILYALTAIMATPINNMFSTYIQMIEFNDKYSKNAENLTELMEVSSGYGLMVKHFLNFALIFLWCKIREKVADNYHTMIYRVCTLGFLWANAFGISVYLSRLTLYYSFFSFIMWVYIAYCIFNNVNLKKYRLIMTCIMLLNLLLFSAGILHSSGGCSPYHFQWIA